MLFLLLMCIVGFSPIVIGGNETGSYLFYMPMAFRSMQIGWTPLISELAAHGHNITIISPRQMFKAQTKNILDIVIDDTAIKELESTFSHDAIGKGDSSIPTAWVNGVIESQRGAFKHPAVQNLVKEENEKDSKVFDVVVVCCAIFGEEPGYYLAHKFNASLVLAHSKAYANPWENWSTGNPFHPAYMPFFAFPYTQHMNLPQRAINSILTLGTVLFRDLYMLRLSYNLLEEVFPNETNFPNLLELEGKASLIMNAGNPFLADGLRPVMPNNLLVGMMNCKPKPLNGNDGPSTLPKKLQDWIDGSGENGVIYMSFGSVLRASSMTPERREMILQVLESLSPMRVIWKWEDEDTYTLPSNILTMPWVPQTSILEHPKVKLFITHGGAGSVQDAICYKTPLLGIPMSNDQITNLHDAQQRGIAHVIPWKYLSKDEFSQAIKTVLDESSSKYQKAIDRLHELVMDQPMHPVDRAVWWMEYILRHPDPEDAIRNPVLELYWWQYFMFDVLLLSLLVLFVIIFIVNFFVRFCICRAKNRKPKNE